MEAKTIDVIIPVYRPDEKLNKLLKALAKQAYAVSRIIIMNTEKKYWEERYEELYDNLEVHHITKAQFDHGGTRREGAKLSTADLMLFMTQDAIPHDRHMVGNLVKAFAEPGIKSAYARQLPTYDCKVLERYTRSFNYPDRSFVQAAEDLKTKGIKTYFCSNVCAAYDRATYEELGGFVEKAIFNEDMLYAAKVIGAGYKIAYVADARVIHSHNYSGIQQFHRNFDLGVSQAEHPEVFADISSEGEGMKLVKKSAAYALSIRRPELVCVLIWQSGCKYLGYLLGKQYQKLPKKMILAATMNRDYWKNV